MASLVAEVLTSTGNLAKDDLTEKINLLMKHVDEVKNQVQDTLDSRYITFFPWLSETIDLSNRVTTASNEISTLRKRIETEIKCELQISTSEMKGLSSNLIEVSITLQIVDKLLEIHHLLEKINQDLDNKEYLLAAQSLEKIQYLLREKVNPCEKQVKIFHALKTEYVIRREKLIYDLGDIWNQNIVWNVKTNENGAIYTQLRINCPNVHEMKSLLRAMQLLNYLDTKLKNFSNHLIHNVCKVIINNAVEIQISDDTFELTVLKESIRVAPMQIFNNLKKIFQFITDSVFNLSLMDKDKEISLMSVLGHAIGVEFSDLLIKDCLTIAIPSNKNDLQDFYRIIEDTTRFQDFLVSIKFLDSDQKNILEYARNVDVLFANKMCRDVLDKARKLMLLQLHDTIQLAAPSDQSEIDNTKSEKKSSKTEKLTSENKLHNVFIFPTCQISASVQQLMDFVYEILNEAADSSPMCAVRLFYTVRNIFELFCAIVPIFHKENLTILPQVAALHHNNCMFLAHHLVTLGHQFSSRLSGPLEENTVTFVDLVPRLRNVGTDAFQSQMLAQKKQLIEIIRGIGGFHNMANDPNFIASLERALKQCLYQLSHLQRVWEPVLPSTIYKQTIGSLIDSLLDELIGQITRQEDIPSNSTLQLTSAFSVLIHRTPNLLQPLSDISNRNNENNYRSNDSSSSLADVCRCVPKWMKFKELLLILAASMNDILERWAEGKGPLAHEFTANEIKQLIRALFQNTERRSAVLARIK